MNMLYLKEMGRTKMKTIETERLILRGWQLNDLDDFYEYSKSPNVGPMAGWEPHRDKEVSKNILKSFIEKDEVWAITLKENGKAIGSIGLHPEENKGKYHAKSIGFVLSEGYWNNGFMTEAVKRVMKYAFDEMNLDILTVFHFPHNLRSKNVILKCGFEYETKLTQTQKVYDGQVFDSVCYSMLKNDYYKSMKNYAIIEITPDELPKCISFWGDGNDRRLIERNTFVYKRDSEYVGGFALFERYEKCGHFSHFYVRNDLRGQGIGSSLLEFAIERLKEMSMEVMRLHVDKNNPRAIKLYEKYGFVYSGEAGLDKMIMLKELK